MQPEEGLDNQNMDNMMAQGVPEHQAMTGDGTEIQGQGVKSGGEEKSKMSKKQIIGLVVLSLIAIGGVLFGIYGMNSQNEQIAELKAQVTEAEEEAEELEEYGGYDVDVEVVKDEAAKDETSVNSENDASAMVTSSFELGRHADYIYVGEWGLKIRIPDDLMIVGYEFGSAGTYGEYLSVTGVKGYAGMTVSSMFMDDDASNGGILRAMTEDGTYPYGPLVFTDGDGNNYYWTGPNAFPGAATGDALELWKESKDVVRDMFSDPNNYSAI